jgi:hypothetical protein
MLRGFQRGHKWQNGFILACIFQFLIEVLLYETVDCVWVHFIIPSSVFHEIVSVKKSLDIVVDKLCSTPVDFIHVLDAPAYFFASTKLSKRYPNMIESIIIQSYHTYVPGEMTRKWAPRQRDSSSSGLFRNFSLFTGTSMMVSNMLFKPKLHVK